MVTAAENARGFAQESNLPGTALAVRRTDSGFHRLPQLRAEVEDAEFEVNNEEAQLRALAAEVAQAAEEATLQHRENNSWVQLELDLWQAVTSTVEKWRRRSSAPALWPHRSTNHRPASRIVGPVRFQLRHR